MKPQQILQTLMKDLNKSEDLIQEELNIACINYEQEIVLKALLKKVKRTKEFILDNFDKAREEDHDATTRI